MEFRDPYSTTSIIINSIEDFVMICVLLIPLFELNSATEIRKITKRNFKRKYRVAIAVFFTVFYVLLLLFATLVPIYYLIFV
ncbi:MAG: hypothetical protein ACOX2F_03475 [bacterium]